MRGRNLGLVLLGAGAWITAWLAAKRHASCLHINYVTTGPFCGNSGRLITIGSAVVGLLAIVAFGVVAIRRGKTGGETVTRPPATDSAV